MSQNLSIGAILLLLLLHFLLNFFEAWQLPCSICSPPPPPHTHTHTQANTYELAR